MGLLTRPFRYVMQLHAESPTAGLGGVKDTSKPVLVCVDTTEKHVGVVDMYCVVRLPHYAELHVDCIFIVGFWRSIYAGNTLNILQFFGIVI